MSELGEALKSAREEKGITLEELQESTKIQKRYLLAIERGDYSQLPGRFYARAFIKSYAEAVGLNPESFFELHSNEIPKAREEVEQLPSRRERKSSAVSGVAPKPSGSSRRPSAIWPSILAAVVIIGLFVIIWTAFQHSGNKSGAKSTNPSNTNVQYAQNKALKKTKQQTKKKTEPAKKDSQSSDQSGTSTGQQQTPPPQPVLTKTGESNGVTEYTLANADQVNLQMAVTGGDCWINVSKSGPNGQHFVYGTIKAGNTVTKDLTGTQQIYIKVGSTPHVKISINGEPFTYPSQSIVQKFLINVEPTQKSS